MLTRHFTAVNRSVPQGVRPGRRFRGPHVYAVSAAVPEVRPASRLHTPPCDFPCELIRKWLPLKNKPARRIGESVTDSPVGARVLRARYSMTKKDSRAGLASETMDTLIFIGLLAVWTVIWQQRARVVVLGAWWVLLILTILLLSHHITSSLKLGLNY